MKAQKMATVHPARLSAAKPIISKSFTKKQSIALSALVVFWGAIIIVGWSMSW